MKYTTALTMMIFCATAFAQSTPGGMPANPSALPTTPAGSTLPGNNASVAPPVSSPADGALQTPGTLDQSRDSINGIQSGAQRGVTPQGERFRRNLQGQPSAIPSESVGIPDPMNPNPGTPPTTPNPLPRAQ